MCIRDRPTPTGDYRSSLGVEELGVNARLAKLSNFATPFNLSLRIFSLNLGSSPVSIFIYNICIYRRYSGWQSLVALHWTCHCTTDRPTAFSKEKLKLVGTSFGLLATAISLTFFLWYREKIPLNYYENNSFCGRKTHPRDVRPSPWWSARRTLARPQRPPGWFIGCDLDLDKYEALCDDWKQVQSYGDTPADEAKIVTALRLRIKGPARNCSTRTRTSARPRRTRSPRLRGMPRVHTRSHTRPGTRPCGRRTSRSSGTTTAETLRRSQRSTLRSSCSTRGSAGRAFRSSSPSSTGSPRRQGRRDSIWVP